MAIHFNLESSPELDTIRIFWACRKVFDIKAFFENKATDFFKSYQRTNYPNMCIDSNIEDDEITEKWEKYRIDMRSSWWGKMMLSQGAIKFGKGKDTHEMGIFFEYSFAKWHNISNGFNNGVSVVESKFLDPIFSVLDKFNALNYSAFESFEDLKNHFKNHFLLRRLDVSLNFKTSGDYPVCEYMKMLSICRLNNGNSNIKSSDTGDFETLCWGVTRGSSYKVMFYDKEKEQKNFFSKNDIDNTENFRLLKKEFYQKNKEKYKDTIRFEIQFRSKFFLDNFKENYKYRRDEKMAKKIIDFSVVKWHKIINEFDAQLGMVNNEQPSENETAQQKAERLLRDQLALGGISNTQYCNLSFFLLECNKIGWQNVRSRYSNQAFSKKYCDLKRLTGYDVKRECVGVLPIIYIMQTEDSLKTTLSKNFVLTSSPIIKMAV